MFHCSSTLETIAAALDSLHVGCCVFDEADCTLLWNPAMLVFFPEHAGHLHAGEHYRFNLRRFYQQRLGAAELHLIDQYIEAGIQRHQSQQRPFVFEHRGRRLRAASLALEGVGRIRLWTQLHESETTQQVPPDEYLMDASRPAPLSSGGLEFVADGLSVMDTQRKITSVNDKFVQMYDIKPQERIVGLRLQEVFELAWRGHEPLEPALYQSGAAAFAENLRFSGAPFELPLPHGRWVRVLEQPAGDGSGYFSHVDITALKHRQLTSEKATRFKSRFLATASHDLRQPVHSLGLLVEMLDQRESPAHFDARVEAIKNCTTTLSEMLNGILDLSKFDLGTYKVQHEPVDIDWLLREVDEVFAPEARRRNLALTVSGGPGHVLSDRHLLRRILLNLVGNALKYSRQGTIRLSCSRVGEKLLLSVQDEGLGIPAGRLATLFDDKLRLVPAHHADEGLGVGLTVVKLAADMLGHPIEVQSVEGEGTTFVLTLPCARAPAGVRAPGGALSPARTPAAALDDVIVFIENDSYTLQSMTELMQMWGYRVLPFASPAEACAAAATMQRVPALVISDMHLNESMTGLAAIEALRHAFCGGVPAMLLTGDLDSTLYRQAIGADVLVVYKPVRPSVFRECLQAAVGRPAAPQPSSTG